MVNEHRAYHRVISVDRTNGNVKSISVCFKAKDVLESSRVLCHHCVTASQHNKTHDRLRKHTKLSISTNNETTAKSTIVRQHSVVDTQHTLGFDRQRRARRRIWHNALYDEIHDNEYGVDRSDDDKHDGGRSIRTRTRWGCAANPSA